jgi:hypothetical protein
VKYDTAEAFRAALDQRIPQTKRRRPACPSCGYASASPSSASSPDSPIAEPGSWVLKGAFALELRLGVRTRATKDIGLAGADDERQRPQDCSPRRRSTSTITSTSM